MAHRRWCASAERRSTALPLSLQWYVRPFKRVHPIFHACFPWAGFVFARGGGSACFPRRRPRDVRDEAPAATVVLGVVGAALVIAGFDPGGRAPSIFYSGRASSFWDEPSPTWFGIPVGVAAMMALTVIYAVFREFPEAPDRGRAASSPRAHAVVRSSGRKLGRKFGSSSTGYPPSDLVSLRQPGCGHQRRCLSLGAPANLAFIILFCVLMVPARFGLARYRKSSARWRQNRAQRRAGRDRRSRPPA